MQRKIMIYLFNVNLVFYFASGEKELFIYLMQMSRKTIYLYVHTKYIVRYVVPTYAVTSFHQLASSPPPPACQLHARQAVNCIVYKDIVVFPMLFNWLTVVAAAQTDSFTFAHPLLVNFISIYLHVCVSVWLCRGPSSSGLDSQLRQPPVAHVKCAFLFQFASYVRDLMWVCQISASFVRLVSERA